jgi:hypothetical protein
MKCFNKRESDDVKAYMAGKHAGVPFTTSWMEFCTPGGGPKETG